MIMSLLTDLNRQELHTSRRYGAHASLPVHIQHAMYTVLSSSNLIWSHMFASAGILKGEAAEREDLLLEGKPEAHLIKALKYRWPRAAFMWFTETYVGGRALFSLWLESLGKSTLARMAEVDAKCAPNWALL